MHALDLTAVVNRNDIRVVESSHGAGLVLEPGDTDFVHVRRRQYFEGNSFTQFGMNRLVNRPHVARPNFFEHLVLTQSPTFEASAAVGSRRSAVMYGRSLDRARTRRRKRLQPMKEPVVQVRQGIVDGQLRRGSV